MIKSMTGYGEAELSLMDFKVRFEIKSLNHRFLDPIFNMPEKFLFLEEKLRNILSKNFSRGRLTIFIELRLPQAQKILINNELAKSYNVKLNDLGKELKLKDVVKLDTLLNLPGVVEVIGLDKREVDEKMRNKIFQIFEIACKNLKHSQTKEGRAILKDLNKNVHLITKELSLVKKRIKLAIIHQLKVFNTEEEKEAFLRDKDITEEINRIEMHLKSFKSVLAKNSAIGKELDFILQELQRETNTIGAKSFDSFISKEVVVIKTEIEKLREQVQNVE